MTWEDNATEEQFSAVVDGEKAKQLLESGIFKEVYEAVLQVIHKRWVNTKPDEQDIREKLYLQSTGLKAMMIELNSLVNKSESVKGRLERNR